MHTVNKTIIHRSNTLWLAISVALFAHIPFSLSAKAATSIVSRVTTDHTLQSSSAPAALVSTDELALDYWFLPGGVIIPAAELLASADSRTQIGAGQVGVASGYVLSQSPPFAGATGGRTPLQTRASATSNWTDTWKVSGGTTGDLVSISLAGYIE